MDVKDKNKLPTTVAELEGETPLFSETRIEVCNGWDPVSTDPEDYFGCNLSHIGSGRTTVSLSLNSWDGREIISIVRRH